MNPLMTVPEVAAVLKCTANTVRKYRREGLIPAIALGGQWRFDPTDIEIFIERNKS